MLSWTSELFENHTLKAICYCASVGLSWLFDGFSYGLLSLVLVWGVDFALGFYRAWITNTVDSRAMWRGLRKVPFYFLSLLCVLHLDRMLDTYYPSLGVGVDLMPFMALFFMSHEVVSVLENLQSLGAPMPKGLVKRLKHINNSLDKKLEGSDEDEKPPGPKPARTMADK